MKRLLIVLLFLPTFSYAQSYLCITEASAGIDYDLPSDKPIGRAFARETKYILKFESGLWKVNFFGSDYKMNECAYRGVYIDCKDFAYNFTFESERKNFVMYSVLGAHGLYENEDGSKFEVNPMIEVGDCSEI